MPSLSSAHRATLLILSVICLACIAILGALFFFSHLNSPVKTETSVHTNTPAVEQPGNVNATNSVTNTTTNTMPVFNTTEFVLVSSDIQDGAHIPQEFTCDGAGTLPELSVLNIPKKTTSLALILHDPDVPADIRSDKTWYHFVVWNLPPTTTLITESMSAPVVYGTTTSRTTTYVPPCPPDAEHRYIFTLYALDTILDLPSTSTAVDVIAAMKGHILKQTTLTATYNRNAKTTSSDSATQD